MVIISRRFHKFRLSLTRANNQNLIKATANVILLLQKQQNFFETSAKLLHERVCKDLSPYVLRCRCMTYSEVRAGCATLGCVSKRIKEVAQTHKPPFDSEHFLMCKDVREWLYISPRTLQDCRNKKIIPYTQFARKILYKTSDLKEMSEGNYQIATDRMVAKYNRINIKNKYV